MIRRVAIVTAGVIAALTFTAVAVAAPLSKATKFTALKGKVTCGVMVPAPNKKATMVLCGAKGIPAPKGPAVGDPGFVQISVLGRPQVLRLSQNSWVAGAKADLGRGRLWNQLGVTCHVAATTVMCFNGDNHGFVIGGGKYRTF
ncbi:MAG: hypothetical protein WAL63_06970 [Solirubrobacteraceae bacterium]